MKANEILLAVAGTAIVGYIIYKKKKRISGHRMDRKEKEKCA